MKNNRFNFIIIGITMVISIVMLLKEDFQKMAQTITYISPTWFIAAILCMIFYWLIEALILFLIVKRLNGKVKYFNILDITMLGQLYNCITPFASGGQPIQAYYMVKNGIDVAVSSSCLLAKFMSYQIALIVYTSVTLFGFIRFFTAEIPGFTVLTIIGYVINIFVVLFFVGAIYFHKVTGYVINFIVKLLAKVKIVKNTDVLTNRIETEMENVRDTFSTIIQKKNLILTSILLSILQLTFYMIIPVTIYFAFNLTQTNLMVMIAAQAFVMMISAFVPLPGASGAAEGSFYVFFSLFFPSGIITVAMVIWRAITYFLTILVGSIFLVKIGFNKVSPADMDKMKIK